MPHRINGEEVLDFDSLETAPVHDEPCPGLPRVWAAHHAMTAAAAQAGVATIMTGLGSDDIFNTEPFQLTELLRSGRLWAAWREASHWADAHNCNVWRFLGPYGFANLQPPWMRMGVGNWMRGGYGTLGRLTEWTIAPWIRPEFARRMDLRTRALASLRSNYYACRPVKLSLLLRFIRTYCGDFNRWYVAAPHGIVLTHPFLDPRMLSLGLGIQSRVLSRPGAQKPILAAALRGILPECILHRPYKRPFNEAHYMGLSANLRRLEALVKQAPVDDLDFLDKGAFLDCLQRTALGSAGDAEVLWPLNGTVSLLVWLSQQHGNFGRRHSVDAAPMVA